MNFVYWLIFGDKGNTGVCRIEAEVLEKNEIS